MTPEQEDALIDLLRPVKEVLDKHGIEFWLDCGTLLGAARDGRFIPWEHDLDFGMWQSNLGDEIKLALRKDFNDRGYRVLFADDHVNIAKRGKYSIFADINFYYRAGNRAIKPTRLAVDGIGVLAGYFSKVWVNPYLREVKQSSALVKRVGMWLVIQTGRALPAFVRRPIVRFFSQVYKQRSKDISWVVPARFFHMLSTIRFYGQEFRIPADVEAYLSYRYGEDWRVPRKTWTTEHEDGAIVSSIAVAEHKQPESGLK